MLVFASILYSISVTFRVHSNDNNGSVAKFKGSRYFPFISILKSIAAANNNKVPLILSYCFYNKHVPYSLHVPVEAI